MEDAPPLSEPRRALAWALALATRLLASTWRHPCPELELREASLAEGPVIFAFLHGQQLSLIPAHRSLPVVGVVSRSADGDLLASVLAHLGIPSVRGSSSRGGAQAARASLRALDRRQCPAIAVDGPRGPRGVAQPGAATLSALSGRPILLVAARARPCLRLRSWDAFEIPIPFARVELRYVRIEPPDRSETAIGGCSREISAGLLALSGELRVASAPAP